MSLCDRCTAGAGCCLDYLDSACKQYRDRECPDVQPTNADRIRAMSDKEMSEHFAKTFCHGYGQPQLLDWLQQPVMDEEEQNV